jgi:hypothetical protein
MEKPVELYVQMYMGNYMYKCIWGIICTNVYGELYVQMYMGNYMYKCIWGIICIKEGAYNTELSYSTL